MICFTSVKNEASESFHSGRVKWGFSDVKGLHTKSINARLMCVWSSASEGTKKRLVSGSWWIDLRMFQSVHLQRCSGLFEAGAATAAVSVRRREGVMRGRPQISHLCYRWNMWRLSHLGFLSRICYREMCTTPELKCWSRRARLGCECCITVSAPPKKKFVFR